MSKLPLSVSYPFTGHQPALSAIERRTVPSREDVIDFFKTHERVSWNLTEILDIGPDEIDVEGLTETDVYVVESTMLVESNNPDYVANLLKYFEADQHACDFIMMWAVEEWKHYYALRDYLTKVKVAIEAREAEIATDDEPRIAEIYATVKHALGEQVADVRDASQENWGIPPHYLPAQVVASTTLQEFVTAEFYRHHASHTNEPTLAMLDRLAELRATGAERYDERPLRGAVLTMEITRREDGGAVTLTFGAPEGEGDDGWIPVTSDASPVVYRCSIGSVGAILGYGL